MEQEKEKIVFSDYYQSLPEKAKIKLRNDFCSTFELSIPTWYNRLKCNNFKTIEFKWIAEQSGINIEMLNIQHNE